MVTGRVTIRKENSHYVVSIDGRGMNILNSRSSAEMYANQLKKQIANMKKRGRVLKGGFLA